MAKAHTAHNTRVVNDGSKTGSSSPFGRSSNGRLSSPRDIPDSIRDSLLRARIWAVFAFGVDHAIFTSDRYSECDKLVKSLLIPACIVRFDPVIYG